MNPHQVTKDFERELCAYTGAPFAVAVNSCTMALLLACAWHIRRFMGDAGPHAETLKSIAFRPKIEIPKRTYVSVPMSIMHAGGQPTFRDEEWRGWYQLRPMPVWDSARYFTAGMYNGATVLEYAGGPVFGRMQASPGTMLCVSFHWSKTLGIQQGGAILHDNYEADQWLRRARFDGRTEGVPPSLDKFTQIGWHGYMSPEVAAEGLVRLSFLPRDNAPLPNDNYPDLSELEIFK